MTKIKKIIAPKKYGKRIHLFLIIIIIYCFSIAVIEGTIEHYLGEQQLFFGLYISWRAFFIALSGFVIGIMFIIMFKENIKKWV